MHVCILIRLGGELIIIDRQVVDKLIQSSVELKLKISVTVVYIMHVNPISITENKIAAYYTLIKLTMAVFIIGQLTGILADLLDLFNGSLGIAGWLIVICIVVVTADIIFIVINLVLPWNVIFGVTVSPT